MPVFNYTQATFSRGEFDPRLYSRTDFEGYNKAAAILSNVMVIPQGGLTTRFGTKHIHTLTTAVASTGTRLFVLEFEDSTKYLCLFEDLVVTIFENDVAITTVVSPYTAAQLPDVKFTQTHDELISVHPDVEPHRLFLVTAPATFSYLKIAFKNEPTYDFLNNYDHIEFTMGAGADALNTDIQLNISATTTYPAIIDIRDMINDTPVGPVLGDRYIHNGANGSIGGDDVEKGDIVEWDGANWQRSPDGTSTGTSPANNALALNNDDANEPI